MIISAPLGVPWVYPLEEEERWNVQLTTVQSGQDRNGARRELLLAVFVLKIEI